MKFRQWQITLSRSEQGGEPTLMPNEVKVDNNEVEAMLGRDTSRTIRLKHPVSKLETAQLKIQRDLAKYLDDYFGNEPMTITEVAPLY